MTENISNNILRTFNIFYSWSKFFNDEVPSHNVLGIELFVN